MKFGSKTKLNAMEEREVCGVCSVSRGMVVGYGNWAWRWGVAEWQSVAWGVVAWGMVVGGIVLVEGRIFKEET